MQPTDPPPPLDYATPRPDTPRRWWSIRSTVVTILVLLIVHVALAEPIAGQMKQIFMDFHLKLPFLTQLYLDVATWWNNGHGWLYAWPLALLASVLLTPLRRPPAPGSEKLRWLLAANLVLLVMNVAIVITAFALSVPMITLIEGISSPSGARR